MLTRIVKRTVELPLLCPSCLPVVVVMNTRALILNP